MSAHLYREEAARRGRASAPALVPLKALAARAGLTLRAVHYQMQIGALSASRMPWRGARTRWMVETQEADRWLGAYRRNARAGISTRASTPAAGGQTAAASMDADGAVMCSTNPHPAMTALSYSTGKAAA